jgi:hypothetical protein
LTLHTIAFRPLPDNLMIQACSNPLLACSTVASYRDLVDDSTAAGGV